MVLSTVDTSSLWLLLLGAWYLGFKCSEWFEKRRERRNEELLKQIEWGIEEGLVSMGSIQRDIWKVIGTPEKYKDS